MIRSLLFLVIFICTRSVLFAQIITVSDAKTGLAVPQAVLHTRTPPLQTAVNAEGKADITNFKDAAEIRISAAGYTTLHTSYATLKASDFIARLSPRPFKMGEVVIAASGFEVSAEDIAAKIVRITPREVAFENPQTAADLLALSGNVFIQKSQQGGGSPMIRGFSTNRLLYIIDGVRMNTAIFRGGNIQNVLNLDPFVMENTEVLFGPGSVIYGSDAIGGVMRFQTLTPQFSLNNDPYVAGKAVMRTASANQEMTAHVDVNLGWEKWALVSSISSWNFDDLRQGSHGPDDYLKPYYVQRIDSTDHIITQDDPLLQIPSAYRQMNIMQKVRFKPNTKWDFEYGFHFSEISPYGRYDRHNRIRNNLPRYAEWKYGAQVWMLNNLQIRHSDGNDFYDEAVFRLAQQTFRESRISRDFNKDLRSIREEEITALSLNLDFQKEIFDKNTLYYGAEIVYNDVVSEGKEMNIRTGAAVEGPSRYPLSTWGTAGIYINDTYKISDKATLHAGVRYSRYTVDATFDTTFYPFPFTEAHTQSGALTGSIGGVFKPSDSWILRANFGTAFRAPNVDDIGKIFDSERGSVVVPNPNLEAEYAYNLDLGIVKVFDNILKLNLTGYYTLLNNALVRRDYTLNGKDSIVYDGAMSKVQAIQNAAQANVYGLQAGIEINLPSGFIFTTDVNYQVGEEERDNGETSPSRHAAPFFGISQLKYSFEKLKLEFYAVYQGERSHANLSVSERGKTEIYAQDANGNTYSPAWYTLNFKAAYRFSKSITLSAGIENLTDMRYRPYSSGISAPGRNFIFAVYGYF